MRKKTRVQRIPCERQCLANLCVKKICAFGQNWNLFPQTFDLKTPNIFQKNTTPTRRTFVPKISVKPTLAGDPASPEKCGEGIGSRVSQTCHTSRRRFAPTERAPRCYHLGGWVTGRNITKRQWCWTASKCSPNHWCSKDLQRGGTAGFPACAE